MKKWIVAAALALAGCGAADGLQPGPGSALPTKPYGATATPTPAQLMQSTNQARPERSDELLRSSDQRRGDEFDLPPTR